MAKKLRNEPIYIAPDILGWIDEQGNPHIIDERNNNQSLNVWSTGDKINIYERQVKDWFFLPAEKNLKARSYKGGFIVLMICLSYIEGVEQYRKGTSTERGGSKRFFVEGLKRIYPGQFPNDQPLEDLYKEARCGLFHNGMVEGRIIINNSFRRAISFINNDIKISPKLFLADIENDFNTYLHELRTNVVIPNPNDPNNPISLRNNFDRMFHNM